MKPPVRHPAVWSAHQLVGAHWKRLPSRALLQVRQECVFRGRRPHLREGPEPAPPSCIPPG